MDLVVLDDGTIVTRDDIPADTGNTESVPRSPDNGSKSDSASGGKSDDTGGATSDSSSGP